MSAKLFLLNIKEVDQRPADLGFQPAILQPILERMKDDIKF